ncbi:exonuclease SbcCD subunit D [uncultured Bacteroides sp.]|uniref:exonuclease SbcCD subunit D n=1 Tax=uncultured Bacteroides sp. TaxID=162156 RepID=UPI0026116D85|nr:exonuclease SbcCD subunit D [uncultured Bacteroides sp.]
MKILHTSDWHLGHSLYNYNRSYEQKAFLSQLISIVKEEQPDAFILSGDVFHYSSPTPDAQRMYNEAMLAIHDACTPMQIVVTAGNHDSSARLEVTGSLWEYFKVKVIGNIIRSDEGVDLDRHIIPVKGKDDVLKGYILAVPYCHPFNFPAVIEGLPRGERQDAFFKALCTRMEEINTAQVPVVMMAHLAVAGSDISGHDETIGGMDYIPSTSLGEKWDYLALGHIHCPQTLKIDTGTARYSGSPLPVNFDESYPHSVTIVELKGHLVKPEIRVVEIINPIPLVTIPKAPVPFQDALKELAGFDSTKKAYIRLNVELKDYLAPDCVERASEAVKGKACKFCYIKTNRIAKEKDSGLPQMDIQTMKKKSPIEIARLYYQETVGSEMDDDLKDLLQATISEVEKEDNRN